MKNDLKPLLVTVLLTGALTAQAKLNVVCTTPDLASLAQAVGAQRSETIVKGTPSLAQAAGIVRAWAIAHGLAVLLLDGRLDGILSKLPPGETEEALVRAVLKRP